MGDCISVRYHQAGNKECAEQVKAVARYRAFLDKHG